MTAAAEPAAQQAPSPPGDPVQLSHSELAALRKWPDPDVLPDDDDVQAMLRAGRPYVFASARMCIDRAGVPASVELVERSGFASYDAKLVATMRTWRYRPLTRDGEARPACAPVAFMYHPAQQFVTLRGCGFGAAFVGHQLFTSPTGSAVKVSNDGKPYDAQLATFDGREPVDGKPVGIPLSNHAGYEVVLWAKPGDLAPVLLAPVLLARTPAEVGRRIALRDPGLRIWRGVPVRILARKQQRVQVRILGDEPALTGWIPAAALGTTYRHELDALPRPGKRIYIASRTALLGQPGGTVLTELRAAERDQAVSASELERQGDHVLVMVQDKRWWAIGWVPAQRLLPAGSVDASHRFRGRPSSGNDQARIELPLGTLLYDKPRGWAFGRTNGRTTAQARATADGHTRIDIEFSGLTIEAWVANPPGAVQR
jgi:hypothetical protein